MKDSRWGGIRRRRRQHKWRQRLVSLQLTQIRALLSEHLCPHHGVLGPQHMGDVLRTTVLEGMLNLKSFCVWPFTNSSLLWGRFSYKDTECIPESAFWQPVRELLTTPVPRLSPISAPTSHHTCRLWCPVFRRAHSAQFAFSTKQRRESED